MCLCIGQQLLKLSLVCTSSKKSVLRNSNGQNVAETKNVFSVHNVCSCSISVDIIT